MWGVKNQITYPYVDSVKYDKFESRLMMKYGNGTKTMYTYDDHTRRLMRHQVLNSNGVTIMNNVYGYDYVGNILNLYDSTGQVDGIGGSKHCGYAYDSLYRLKASGGVCNINGNPISWWETPVYYPSGKFESKQRSATGMPFYSNNYNYQATQPHALTTLESTDENNNVNNIFHSYDLNANLVHIEDYSQSINRSLVWDEDNRLQLIADMNDKISAYLYDAGGDRKIKIQGNYSVVSNNGVPIWEGFMCNKQTMYVNPYMVITRQDYTKHYYIENERITSKIGGGFADNNTNIYNELYGFNCLTSNDYVNKTKDNENMIRDNVQSTGNPYSIESDSVFRGTIYSIMNMNEYEGQRYFYHSDHLGSSSFITDGAGISTQHVEYLPFGETLADEHVNFNTPYKFNAKELDDETGLYYYGARYYDPRISVWLGVDPMSDKYPSWSAFAYCLDNPIRFIDPDGSQVGDYVKWNGKRIGNDGYSDDKVHLISSGESIKTIRTNTKAGISTSQANVSIDVTTTKSVIKEASNVLSRTIENGGLSEESSVVTPSGEVHIGVKGPETMSGQATANLPFVEGNNNTSIHSHPTATTDKSGWNALTPGKKDPGAFKNYNLNIIVGPLGDPFDNKGNDVPRDNGAVLFDRNSSRIGILRTKAIERILE
jgi:RHS repeat-associated protein